MMDYIKEFMDKKDFYAALSLIQEKLNESYNLGLEGELKKFSELNDLKTDCEIGLLEELCGIINKSEVTRSYTDLSYVSRPKVSLSDLSNKKYYLEAFSQVRLEKNDPVDSDCNAVINVLFARNDSIGGKTIPLERFSAGDSFEADIKGKRCFFILAADKGGGVNFTATMESFNNVIGSIYEAGINRVGIALSLPCGPESNDLRKLYVQFTIIQLLLKIVTYRSDDLRPIFTFFFEDDYSYENFQRILIRLNRPEERIQALSANRSERFSDFVRKCLTKDPIYIERLKGIFNVIDETEVPILILGESGVGKSMLAQNIHFHSICSSNQFEEQNCGGLSEDKLDQRLFGWKKGAFTGAVKDTKGKIARAEGGTLFLDEIDRMPQAVRNGLLTFIDTKKYDVIGSESESQADVRLIFGTNKNLKEMVRKSQFEEDFYYRINRRIIEIPPLRDRKCDIPLIIDTVLSEMNGRKNKYISMEPDAVAYLKEYCWPGNVRELVSYIKQRYLDSSSEDCASITIRQCELAPFENLIASREDDYIELLEAMKKLLMNWDSSKGNFLDEILGPMLAKTYMDDCFRNLELTKKKEGAMAVIGISGTNFNKSKLQTYYDKFASVKEKLGF